MPNLPISGLTASASNLAATDVLPVTQTAGVGPVKMTGLQLAGGLLGSTSLTGATVTTSQPLLDLSQTWNAGGVTFTGMRFNAAGSSDANSAATSLLMDLQVGGASRFAVNKAGRIFSELIGNDPAFGAANAALFFSGVNAIAYSSSGEVFRYYPETVQLGSLARLTWSDLFLGRRAAANLRLGAADAAAPVAQTLSVQSVVAGTTNTAGTNFTIAGSQGTGTGAGGSLIFQVAPAGSSGSAQNALATVLTISGTGAISTPTTSANTLTIQGSFSTTSTFNFVSWSAAQLGWAAASGVSPSTALDTGLKRSAAAIVGITDGSTGGGSLEMQEVTAPAAPATNNVRIYAEDNGSSKTRLMARFATGAAVQIAIEP